MLENFEEINVRDAQDSGLGCSYSGCAWNEE